MTEITNRPVNDRDPIDNRRSNLMSEELEIVGYFARGQKQSISSQNLKLEATETSIRLSDRQGRLIGISKQVNQWQRKVLISNTYSYRTNIIQTLTDVGFITRQKSSHPEFTEYHYYQVPDGYKLNYTEVIELWKVWWNHKRYQLNNPCPPIDVLTFSKGNWCLVEDLQPKQGNFILRTVRGEIKIEPEEYVVWIDSRSVTPVDRTDARSIFPAHSTTLGQQNPAANPSNLPATSGQMSMVQPSRDSRSASSTPRDQSLPLPQLDEEIDLESYLNTFNTEDTEDVDRIEGIYNIGELLNSSDVGTNAPPLLTQLPNLPLQPVAPPTPVELPTSPAQVPNAAPEPSELSLMQRQESLKLKAMQVLITYLQEGDRIVRTEVSSNGRGQEIDRKIVKIQRGCPSWAIDQAIQLTALNG